MKPRAKITPGSRHFFFNVWVSDPKSFSDFFFYRNKVQVKKKLPILEKFSKKNFYRKKIRLQVSKSGVFAPEKVSLIFFFFFLEITFRWKKISVFSKICEKLFLSEKIRLQVSKWGVFVPEKVSLIFFPFYRNKLYVK